MEELKQKARDILDNVEFLHGVPVSVVEEVKKAICDLIEDAYDEGKSEVYSSYSRIY